MRNFYKIFKLKNFIPIVMLCIGQACSTNSEVYSSMQKTRESNYIVEPSFPTEQASTMYLNNNRATQYQQPPVIYINNQQNQQDKNQKSKSCCCCGACRFSFCCCECGCCCCSVVSGVLLVGAGIAVYFIGAYAFNAWPNFANLFHIG